MKPTLVVINVEPITPGSESATVTLRSEKAEVVAFCYPCSLKAGDVVPNKLSALDGEVKAAYLSDWPEEMKKTRSKERLENTKNFSYRGCGKVMNQQEGLVDILGFVVDFGSVSYDGPVEFEISRLDIW